MDLVIRSVVVFCFIFGLTRIIGRRELSSLEPVTGAVLVIGTLALLQVFTSFLSFKVPRLRPFLEGEPVIIFEDGRPVERNLRRERITVDEIAAQARMQQIESLGDVKWAVLETNGQITFIKKAADGS